MMLGRLFDPRDTGLLLTLVEAPTGRRSPCASSCPPRPSTATRSTSCAATRASTPTACSTSPCAHHRAPEGDGDKGLSLNFAAMRSVLEGETATASPASGGRCGGCRAPADRDALAVQRQVRPRWLPRYVVFDAAEHLVAALAIARAESFWELPLIGRFLLPADSEDGSDHHGAADRRTTSPRQASWPPLRLIVAGDAGPATLGHWQGRLVRRGSRPPSRARRGGRARSLNGGHGDGGKKVIAGAPGRAPVRWSPAGRAAGWPAPGGSRWRTPRRQWTESEPAAARPHGKAEPYM